jgi:hypothetical protein
MEIIDGLQRINSIVRFLKGELTLKLPGTDYHEKKYSVDDEVVAGIANKSINCTVIEQLNPDTEESGKYEIFKILNQGSVSLTAHEVRRCVYESEFTDLLSELNKNENWRKFYGRKFDNAKNRYYDEEIILRSLCMCLSNLSKMSNLTKEVNKFSHHLKSKDNFDKYKDRLVNIFNEACNFLSNIDLGTKNKAVIDAILSTAMYKSWKNIDVEITQEKVDRLKNDDDFKKSSSSATGSKSNVIGRFSKAKEILLGIYAE